MRLRGREIVEGVVVFLLGTALVAAFGLLTGTAQFDELVSWLWAVLRSPVGVPLGVILLLGAAVLPVLWRTVFPREVPHEADGVYTGLHVKALDEPLTSDELAILAVFVQTGDTHIMAAGLDELVGHSKVRMEEVREGLVAKGYIKWLPPTWAGDPGYMELTPIGRKWVLSQPGSA